MSLDATLMPRPRAVYLLVHPLEPLRRDALEQIERAAAAHIGLEAFNKGVFRANETGTDALQAAKTLPMMAAQRLVIITHMEEGSASFYEALLGYLENPSETTCLVLVGASFPKVVKGGRRWSSLVAKHLDDARSWTLDRKARLDLVSFSEGVVGAEGKKIERGAVQSLIAAFEGKPAMLEQELRKLVLYAEGPTITEADVAAATNAVGEAAIWDLTSAIVSRDSATALTVLQRLQNQGFDSRHILGSVSWKLRGVAIAADALRQGASEGTASKASKLKSFEVRKVKGALENLPSSADLIGALARANLEMNSHRAGDQRILERLILGWT